MWTVIWASIALDIQPMIVSVFDCIAKRGFSSRITFIPCQISVYRQLFDRRPGGLLPTLCV